MIRPTRGTRAGRLNVGVGDLAVTGSARDREAAAAKGHRGCDPECVRFIADGLTYLAGGSGGGKRPAASRALHVQH